MDAYPNLVLEQYDELKTSQEFLFTQVKICEDCFLVATEDHLVSSTYDKTKKRQPSAEPQGPVSRRAIIRAFTVFQYFLQNLLIFFLSKEIKLQKQQQKVHKVVWQLLLKNGMLEAKKI